MKPMENAEAADVLKRRKLMLEQHEPAHPATHVGWVREVYALNLAIEALSVKREHLSNGNEEERREGR